ncbi:MAG: PTS sugar transporter subunit IIB [Clostridia bacterium]|jgi:PTS system galactitol-specific IIB component|nr:PTS sugar transporter subunit IIB [Clostridia bacterium]
MAKSYSIICACGSSIATSTLVASKLKALLQENNIEATIKKTSYADLEKDIAVIKPDLVLTTTNLKRDLGVPCLIGIAYLTGVGKAELDRKILEVLKSKA